MDASTFGGAIATGVLSGVLTSVLTYIAYKFYQKVIKPQYIDLVYTGIYIDGTWRGIIKVPHGGGVESETSLLLNITKQHGSELGGVFYAETKRTNGYQYSNQYKMSGKIRNNWVILNYEPFSNRRLGLGAFVLTIEEGGQELHGTVSYSESEKNLSAGIKVVLKRETA